MVKRKEELKQVTISIFFFFANDESHQLSGNNSKSGANLGAAIVSVSLTREGEERSTIKVADLEDGVVRGGAREIEVVALANQLRHAVQEGRGAGRLDELKAGESGLEQLLLVDVEVTGVVKAELSGVGLVGAGAELSVSGVAEGSNVLAVKVSTSISRNLKVEAGRDRASARVGRVESGGGDVGDTDRVGDLVVVVWSAVAGVDGVGLVDSFGVESANRGYWSTVLAENVQVGVDTGVEVAAIVELLVVPDRLSITSSCAKLRAVRFEVDGLDESPLTGTVAKRSVDGGIVVTLKAVTSRS